MPVRNAEVIWEGSNTEGKGTIHVAGASMPYTRASRFEEAPGTNPEELLGAAHAACFSMALAGQLTHAEFPPKKIHTTAKVKLEKVEEGFKITQVLLETEADVPGIEQALFLEKAEAAKKGCPVSMALAGVEILLNANLL